MSGSSRRLTLKKGVISAMCAASQLPGSGPTDVDDNQKSDYDNDILFVYFVV